MCTPSFELEDGNRSRNNSCFMIPRRTPALCQELMNILHAPVFLLSSYTFIGASDKIFDHLLFRSSFPTTLVNRVPIGSPFLLMRTQALSSNLMRLPSFRSCSFRCRTTTACLISPLRTLLVIPKLVPPGPSDPKFLCF